MADDEKMEIDDENSNDNRLEFDENFIIKLNNENSNNIINRNAKQCCKIIQISSELNISQEISSLSSSEYPNLFILIIKQNENLLSEIQEAFAKFSECRPLFIVETFKNVKDTKVYYKEVDNNQFVDLDQQYSGDDELHLKYKTIFNYNLELKPFENEVLAKLAYINKSSIIIRFLRILNLTEAYFGSMVLKIAENGSKADFLAVLDAPFDDYGIKLNNQAQRYFQLVFEGDKSEDELLDDCQDDLMDGTLSEPEKENSSESVFLTAVQHKNKEIIDYLITYWSHLLQQLPFEHQIKISTTAYDTNQYDVLCDLLNISDYPFPNDFTFSKSKVNEKLFQVTNERMEFKTAIEREDFCKIDNFIGININNKLIYSINNNSALTEALKARQFSVFYYLKSLGYQGEKCEEVIYKIKPEEKNAAVMQATEQRRLNTQLSLKNCQSFIFNLWGKSLIFNRKISKNIEAKYREFILNWFKEIYKIAPEMIEVAASCEELKIIFDFESYSAENASLGHSNAVGENFSACKWIFIGAKFTDNAREQMIKGILAHELCHYVMNLVYENEELPYYKDDIRMKRIFMEIVKITDQWSLSNEVKPNDECDGIISIVYEMYQNNAMEQELIVRVVNILAHFSDNEAKSNLLREKYQELFKFWYDYVVPELQNYFNKDKVTIRINTTAGLLSSISNSKIEFSTLKNMNLLTNRKIIIVKTNAPKLLFINIYKHLQETYKSLVSSLNLFLTPENIKNDQIWKDIRDLYARDVKRDVFVACIKGNVDNIGSIMNINKFNFILVTSSEEQINKLKRLSIKKKIIPVNEEIIYNWNDLTSEMQLKFLQTEITFQNNMDLTLMELLSMNSDHEEIEIENFTEVIDDQLLNLLVDGKEVYINSPKTDDLKAEKFKNLFQERTFLKKGVGFKNEISQEKLVSNNEGNKYVLISDIAGSGKSWVVKNISKIIQEKYPTRWVTYVDLKQFIEEFKMPNQNFEFEEYFIEKILKPETEFEANIFKILYKDGRVSIIFDGFDEIAPNCAEFVTKLAKSFEFYDGNQLWIVTRDYFEVNLQDELGIENTYKLTDLTENEGIDFIVASWVSIDSGDEDLKNFKICLQNSPNLDKYKEKATKIVQNISMSKNQSIGMPQLFSMIVDCFKKDDKNIVELNGAKIFTEFANEMYIRWTDLKGKLRKRANVKSQHYELSFIKFHQYCAIASSFPDLLEFLFPDYDDTEWPETEIVACGIMKKAKSFIHETFREFFVADFIYKALVKQKVKIEIVDLFTEILTVQKYGIIRMFINDFIENESEQGKTIKLELQPYANKLGDMEIISEFFTENQKCFANFIIEILKKLDYSKVKNILNNNIKSIVTKSNDLKIFATFVEFWISYLNDEDLKDMTNDKNLLQELIGSNQSAEILNYFISKLDEKFDKEFVRNELKNVLSGPETGNIFYHLGTSQNLTTEIVQQVFKSTEKYLNVDEILDLMNKTTQDGQTILKILLENTANFEPFFEGMESILIDQKLWQRFRKIMWNSDSKDEHILHWSSTIDQIDFHVSMWKLIQKTFENCDELKTFILHKNSQKNNFLHLLVIQNNFNAIEFTIQNLKAMFSDYQDYQEMLRSKGQSGRNLLQIAAENSKEIQIHQFLWKEIRESCKSNEKFLEILDEVDENGNEVFNLAASSTIAEIFTFMEQELEKIASNENIRKKLANLGKNNRNILQRAVALNESSDFHKTLWNILRKYFNSYEMLEFIKNLDIYRDNVLINVVDYNTKEIGMLTWNEVKNVLSSITGEYKNNIEKCEKIMEISSKLPSLENVQNDFLRLKWIKNENLQASKLFHESHQRLIEQNLKTIEFENIKFFMAEENIENHEKLWKTLEKIDEDLKIKLLSEKNKNGNNFVHLIVNYNTANIIEYTLQKYEENLSKSDYNKMLRSRGQDEKNLFHVALQVTKEIKTIQILWIKIQNSCASAEEFLEIVEEVDKNNDNIFHYAAAFSTSEILKFIEQQLVMITSKERIKKILTKLGFYRKTSLLIVVTEKRSLEFFITFWNLFKKYFEPCEILEIVKHTDVYGCSMIFMAKYLKLKTILQYIWNEIKDILKNLYTDDETIQNIKECDALIEQIIVSSDYEDESDESSEDGDKGEDDGFEMLDLDWIDLEDSRNLFEEEIFNDTFTVQNVNDLMRFVTNKNISNHKMLWEYLEKNYNNEEKLAKLLSDVDEDGNIFIHALVVNNTAENIEFNVQKFKESLNSSDYKAILRFKGQFDRNLLLTVVSCSKEVKTLQIFWTEYRELFSSNEEFLDILKEVDGEGNNILHMAALFATGNILKFLQQELNSLLTQEQMKEFLTTLGFAERNLLQAAAQQNKCLEFHEVIWEILEKYFISSEIFQFILHYDIYERNVILNALGGNTKTVIELTWSKVRKFLIKSGYENNDSLKLCDAIMKTDLNFYNLTNEQNKALKLESIENKNSNEMFKDNIEKFIRTIISSKSLEDLMPFIMDEKFKHHDQFWKHLEKNFKNYEEVKEFIFKKDENSNTFIHLLVIQNTSDNLEIIIKKFNEILKESDFYYLLRLKGQFGRNLLQHAVVQSKDVKTLQILWKEIQDSCKTNKNFWNVLLELDNSSDNILGLAAAFTTDDIFQYILKQLEKFELQDVKTLFTHLGNGRQNLMQAAVTSNKSVELHETLWKVLEKYFEIPEILLFVVHRDVYGCNLVYRTITGQNTKEVKQLTWNKIKTIILHTECENHQEIKLIDEILVKNLDIEELSNVQIEVLKLNWINSSNSIKLFENGIESLMNKDLSILSSNDLNVFMADENIENHKFFWKYLEEKFNNKEKLKLLLCEKDNRENNFIHRIMIFNTLETIEFTFKKLKETFNETNYHEILEFKRTHRKNLIQRAVYDVKDIKKIKFLWNIFRDCCKNNEEFLKLLGEINDMKFDVLHLAASFKPIEVFNFIIMQLEELGNKEQIKKLLSSFGEDNNNLLQSIATLNRNIETHKTVWKVIDKYFDEKEILTFIEHRNNFDKNILCCAITYRTKEIVEFIWNQIKIYLNSKELQTVYLNEKLLNENLVKLSLKYLGDDSEVVIFVRKVLEDYAIRLED